MKQVTDHNFNTEVIANDRLTLVDFWAEWCGPCKALMPALEEVSKQFSGRVDIVKLNIDDSPAMPSKYGVRGIPTLILIKNGEAVARIGGVQSASQIAKFLETHLDGKPADTDNAKVRHFAFGGDADRKAMCIARLQSHFASETVRISGTTFWNGTEGSPLGCATHESNERAVSAALGMPRKLTSAVDVLCTYMGNAAGAEKFAVSWLDAMPVGAETSKLAERLLLDILNSYYILDLAKNDRKLLTLRDHLAALHRTEHGQHATTSDWNAFRHECAEYCQLEQDPVKKSLGKLFNELAWPMSEDDGTIRSAVNGIAATLRQRIALDLKWTREDQTHFDKLIPELVKQAEVNGERPNIAAQLKETDPDFAQRHRVHSEQSMDATRKCGQTIGRMLLERTASLV